MSLTKLFTIETTNDLGLPEAGILLITPDFAVPENWADIGWRERTEPVMVKTPEGEHIDATAQINMTHLNIPDPDIHPRKRWRIKIWLTDRSKDEIPVGSELFVPPDVAESLKLAEKA